MRPLPKGPEPHHDHAVQFYRDSAGLVKTLSRFTRDGLAASQPVIIIATAEHRAALATQLLNDGLPRDYFERQGRLWMLDARETLDTFMAGGRPNESMFTATIGALLDQARVASDGGPIRAYGEMVDILWNDGNPQAAIQLERMWNRLAETRQFTLLCGYAIGSFYRETNGFDIGDVCKVHSRILPA